MKRSAVVCGLLLAVIVGVGCQNEDQPSGPGPIIITNTNTNTIEGASGSPAASPSPGGPVSAVHLGCDNMTGPGGQALPGCGGALADYEAPSGSSGRLDATPVDNSGNKVHGLAVESWNNIGNCALEGDTFGSDGFNPTIHINAGECLVTVRVAGLSATRKFIGQ